jgi:hypothetical protein
MASCGTSDVSENASRAMAIPRALPRACTLAAVSGCALLLGACGATMNDLTTSSTTVAGYQAANLFSPTGYSMSSNADGSVRVTAAGPPATPADRLEKIALARAAEYGDEQHLKTFTATPAQTSFKCGKTEFYVKGEKNKVMPLDYRVVAIDVSYGTDAMSPAARNTRETAQTLKAQLASETVPPNVQAAATQEALQQCGRSSN